MIDTATKIKCDTLVMTSGEGAKRTVQYLTGKIGNTPIRMVIPDGFKSKKAVMRVGTVETKKPEERKNPKERAKERQKAAKAAKKHKK